MISRLTVRLHRLVTDADQAWITGVLLAREGAQVLVQRLPQGGEIELRARGVDRKALLSVVAGELDALNQSFAGLGDKVDKRIPCVCSPCRRAEPPWFFGQRAPLRRREARQLQVQCETSFESVSVLELLDGIGGAELPGLREGTRHDSGLPLRELTLFLASSSELADERDAFDLHFQRHNEALARQGLKLRIIRWEYFLDAMSETKLQDEYNRAVADCDIFVSLFFRKAGLYTVEEFKVAHDQFKARGKPAVYTYFKDAEVSTGSIGKEFRGLLDFKDRLRALGHYPSNYTSAADLHLQFRDQIALLCTRWGPA